jgi:ribosomal-protein-alanine N-acetyltransferase
MTPRTVAFLPEHLEGAYAIEQATSPHLWSERNFSDSLQAGARAWVVEEADKVLAFALMQCSPFEAEVLNIATAPAHQRQGHGQRLLMRLIDSARAQGLERLLLEVRSSNASAQRLYARNGFQIDGVRARYYQQPCEDAVLMSLLLAV